MNQAQHDPVPVREALEDVATTGRSLLMKRLDLMQLEAERLLDDAASRLYSAVFAVVLASLALLTGSVALIAYGTPEYGVAGAAGILTGCYFVLACIAGLVANRRRTRSLLTERK